MVLKYDPTQRLPSSFELPDSDDTPVDNELQNLIPNLLASTLALNWATRDDWFFGVDMGVYFAPKESAIVPDGFLSLGVERRVNGEDGRLSYVLWEEDNIVPTLALEVVSKTYGGEYERKRERYIDLGIPYYAVYLPNPRRYQNRDPLEVYHLVNGGYQRLSDAGPIWLPEIGLALGRDRGIHQGWEREWLYWYDEMGKRLLTPEESAVQAQIQAAQAQMQIAQAQAKAERLAAKLQELGIDPNEV